MDRADAIDNAISTGCETCSKPHKTDVLWHPALLGIELKVGTSSISYSDIDPDAQRARMGQEQI